MALKAEAVKKLSTRHEKAPDETGTGSAAKLDSAARRIFQAAAFAGPFEVLVHTEIIARAPDPVWTGRADDVAVRIRMDR